MKVTVNKCKYCKTIFENDKEYQTHIKKERALREFELIFPRVKDSGSDFANGGWTVRRDEEWLDMYKQAVVNLVNRFKETKTTPWTYGWYRTLDNSDSMFYGVAVRVMDICKTCYREWGQAIYADHCVHRDIKKGDKEWDKVRYTL